VCIACEPRGVVVSGGSNDVQNPTGYFRSKEIMFVARMTTSCTGNYVVATFCQPTWYAYPIPAQSATADDSIILPSQTMVLVIPPRFLPYSVYKILVKVVSCREPTLQLLKLNSVKY
jgi:hypothetical protein